MNRHMLMMAAVTAVWIVPGALGQGPDREERRGGPALGVARVSVTDGDVTLRRPSGDTMQAQAGMPLVGGDAVATGASSRAEVQLGRANFLRLGEQAEVKIGELGNRRYRVEIVRGAVSYSELRGGEADTDLDAPAATVRPLKNGVYRVEVMAAGQTNVIVRKGEAEVATSGGVQKLKKGRRMTVRGEEKGAQVRTEKAQGKDRFDRWSERRDKLLKRDRGYHAWGFPPYWGPWYPYHYGFGFGYGYHGYRGYGHYRPGYRRVVVRGRGRGRHR